MSTTALHTIPKKTPLERLKKWCRILWQQRALVALCLIPLAVVILFQYVPMYGVLIAFKKYKPKKGVWGSAWLDPWYKNFQEFFNNVNCEHIILQTVKVGVLSLIFTYPMPIILALMLNELRAQKYKRVVQSLSYLPHFISWVILTGIFMVILSPTRGPINTLRKSLGLESIYFLGDPKYFQGTLVVTGIWKGIGWGSIVYLAALGGVNEELYDAARVDGCGRWARIWHVTLPGITPVVTIMLILAMGSLVEDDFDQIFNLLNDAVLGVGDVLGTFIYRQGVKNLDYGYATAVELFRNLISLVLVLSANYFSKRINEYGLW